MSIIEYVYGQLYQSYRPFWQRTSSSVSQQNPCSYGGGVINNSTVIEIGNCGNGLYFINLGIGSSSSSGPQYFNFQFDTGTNYQ